MYTFDMLNEWSLGDLQELCGEMGVDNADEWDKEDCIDFILDPS